MSKLAIAAAVTATLAAGGLLVATATRGSDAHARNTGGTPGADGTRHATAGDPGGGALAGADRGHAARPASVLATAPKRAGGSQAAGGAVAHTANDCATVGRYLAELEADMTHGPSERPDEATCEQCAGHYRTQCETEGWSVQRRICTLAAGDVINAHLCAGAGPAGAPADADVPAELTCSMLGAHIATTVHAAGWHTDVLDMPQQVAAACDMAGWPLELRRCFAAGTTVDALQACVVPPDQNH